MAQAALPILRTVDEFLAWENQQAERYEFVGGVLTLMAGGTENYDLVGINVAAVLNQRLRGTPCRVWARDCGRGYWARPAGWLARQGRAPWCLGGHPCCVHYYGRSVDHACSHWRRTSACSDAAGATGTCWS